MNAWLLMAALFVLWFVLCRHLSNEWSINEQYNYGWFVPFFALFLFWQRWEEIGGQESEVGDHGREVEIRKEKGENGRQPTFSPLRSPFLLSKFYFLISTSAFAFLLFLLLPLRVFEIGNPDWRPLGWLHSAIVVGLTFLIVSRIGGKMWVRHFYFPIAFIFIAVPWVTPIEAPIVQGLMRMVAGAVCEAVNLCGIPAQLEGSVIRTSNGLVGVNEACSGVRSLQTSIMVGLLFGELKRLSIAKRIVLLFGAIAIALGANFLRAFLLVWTAATNGLPAVERWHDVTGYSIVIAVFVGTLATAHWLARRNAKIQKTREEKTRQRPNFFLPNLYLIILSLAWLLLVEASAYGWYRIHETHLVPRIRWTVQWPENSPGFREVRIDENVRRTLRYDEGRGVIWHSPALAMPLYNSLGVSDSASIGYLLYFFRWQSGHSSVLRARAHRPDICLPNTGWETTADDGVRKYFSNQELVLPFRHFEFVRARPESRPQFAHAFFCVREDWIKAGSNAAVTDTQLAGKTGGWMRSDRLRTVLEGERDLGQQVMELVMVSGNRVPREEAEARFTAMLPGLIKLKR